MGAIAVRINNGAYGLLAQMPGADRNSGMVGGHV